MDDLGVSTSKEVSEILDRYPQVLCFRQHAVHRELACIDSMSDRRKGRNVPDHRKCAVFGMHREGESPFDELTHGRLLRRRDPLIRYAFSACLFDNIEVERIEENAALRFVEIRIVLGACKLFYLVGIVEDDPYIANAARA